MPHLRVLYISNCAASSRRIDWQDEQIISEQPHGGRETGRWEGEPYTHGGRPEKGPDNADDDTRPVIRWRRGASRVAPKDFDAAQKHLRECGVVFTGPVDHDASLSVYFNDPDGNPLEITCYP